MPITGSVTDFPCEGSSKHVFFFSPRHREISRGEFKEHTHMDTNESMPVSSRRKAFVAKEGLDERILDGIETILVSHEIKLNQETHRERAHSCK